jgi:hypothetical protein
MLALTLSPTGSLSQSSKTPAPVRTQPITGKENIALDSNAPAASVAQEDTTLLNFILPQKFRMSRPGIRGYVIQRETIPLREIQDTLSFAMHRRRHPQQADRKAFDDFARRNASARRTPSLDLGIPLVIVTRNTLNKIFVHGGWTGFYKKYPQTNGMISLSLPGYASDRNTALVYITWRSGGLAGAGLLILLERKTGQWSVKETITGWQS